MSCSNAEAGKVPAGCFGVAGLAAAASVEALESSISSSLSSSSLISACSALELIAAVGAVLVGQYVRGESSMEALLRTPAIVGTHAKKPMKLEENRMARAVWALNAQTR